MKPNWIDADVPNDAEIAEGAVAAAVNDLFTEALEEEVREAMCMMASAQKFLKGVCYFKLPWLYTDMNPELAVAVALWTVEKWPIFHDRLNSMLADPMPSPETLRRARGLTRLWILGLRQIAKHRVDWFVPAGFSLSVTLGTSSTQRRGHNAPPELYHLIENPQSSDTDRYQAGKGVVFEGFMSWEAQPLSQRMSLCKIQEHILLRIHTMVERQGQQPATKSVIVERTPEKWISVPPMFCVVRGEPIKIGNFQIIDLDILPPQYEYLSHPPPPVVVWPTEDTPSESICTGSTFQESMYASTFQSSNTWEEKDSLPRVIQGPGSIGKVTLCTVLGSGGCARVYQGWTDLGTPIAVKGIERKAGREEPVAREIGILTRLEHTNIVKCIGVVNSPTETFIFMEFLPGGSSASLLHQFGGRLPEKMVSKFTFQILGGLEYLHDNGIAHLDIKGENVLLDKDGTLKLADFGISRNADEFSLHEDLPEGTPHYMAPEVAKGDRRGPEADVWGVGCTVLQLLTGLRPFHDVSREDVIMRLRTIAMQPAVPEHISETCRSFLEQCFQPDYHKRASVKSLLQHPFVSSVTDLRDV